MAVAVKDKEEFDAKLKEAGENGVIVDFFATWCGPCKVIAPFLENLAGENAGKYIVLKVDVDDNAETAEACQVTAMPTFILFRNGKEVKRVVGADKNELKELFSA